MDGEYTTNGDKKTVRRLVGQHEGKRLLGIPRRNCSDDIKDIGLAGMDWIYLA
jgi:hypothetical protein